MTTEQTPVEKDVYEEHQLPVIIANEKMAVTGTSLLFLNLAKYTLETYFDKNEISQVEEVGTKVLSTFIIVASELIRIHTKSPNHLKAAREVLKECFTCPFKYTPVSTSADRNTQLFRNLMKCKLKDNVIL